MDKEETERKRNGKIRKMKEEKGKESMEIEIS